MTGMSMPRQEWYLGLPGYLRMWMTMMVPMMLPSLVPMVSRYRRSVPADGIHRHGLTALVGVGYFVIWACLGVVAYGAERGFMADRAGLGTCPWVGCPVRPALVLLAAGGVQLTDGRRGSWPSAGVSRVTTAALSGARPGRVSAWPRIGPRCSLACGA